MLLESTAVSKLLSNDLSVLARCCTLHRDWYNKHDLFTTGLLRTHNERVRDFLKGIRTASISPNGVLDVGTCSHAEPSIRHTTDGERKVTLKPEWVYTDGLKERYCAFWNK